ncbi:glycoside hydrolase family 68 protein [Arsenicicoccus piscis]|nr:glycoside hydrolase family 68 protein [Arsenicicoccus piscis]MCH8627041.1 glycoside hydrolase family 68 protein [Arsenicicoccus piscis]
MKRIRTIVTVGVVASTGFLAAPAAFAGTSAPPGSQRPAATPATTHTQDDFSPWSNFTMRWTRADAQKIKASSDPNVAPGTNSLPTRLTMPEIPVDFPVMKDKAGKQVWVWDTWPLTDAHGNTYSFKGWNVIFSLTADPYAGYTFDDRHVNARISYWFRKASEPNKPWIYGGHVFGDRTPKTQAEWSGSARVFNNGQVKLFYTHLDFADRAKPDATIALSTGALRANANGVWLTGFTKTTPLLKPDGTYYQTNDQNPYFSFRDPYTFEDPAHPGKTFMVFEGNTAGKRGDYQCQRSDLGRSGENPAQVTSAGANYQMANIGLAVATNANLTKWKFLPPILSANCVNDQTERPQFVIKKVGNIYKYYLFTISHAFTYAAGLRGPDGVYGFVGNGIRSDFQPLNGGGLVLGNPTDLNLTSTDPLQNGRQFQAYSHYVMPGGLVESFIDNVEGRRGGTLAPTVKLRIGATTTSVDRSVGTNGLLGYGYIPALHDIG